jgi:transcriptional regulator with XRE-family HTH domain
MKRSAAPQRPANGFTSLYSRQDGLRGKSDPNGRRLAALVKMFGLSHSAVARATGVSPAYLSRIMNDSDPFVGSADFYRRLEACLGQLIDQRPRQFFRVVPVNVRSVERAARDVLKMAA